MPVAADPFLNKHHISQAQLTVWCGCSSKRGACMYGPSEICKASAYWAIDAYLNAVSKCYFLSGHRGIGAGH